MRYSDRVTLHKGLGRQYNPETGQTEYMVDEGVTLPCNLSPTSLEKVTAVFGSIDQKITTVRLQRPYKGDVDKAMIGDDKFKIVRHIPYKSESVFFVEGVSEWN